MSPHVPGAAWLLTLLLFGGNGLAKPPTPSSRVRQTERVLSYLDELHRTRLVDEQGLRALIASQIPISSSRAATDPAASVHRDALARELRQPGVDQQRIVMWATERLADAARTHGERANTQHQTNWREMNFVPISH